MPLLEFPLDGVPVIMFSVGEHAKTRGFKRGGDETVSYASCWIWVDGDLGWKMRKERIELG